MVIDADCHISSQKLDSVAITADELVDIMDEAEVDKALIWLKPPYNKDIGPENRAVYEATQRYPDRFFGFGWANPLLGKAHTLDTIYRCFEEYNFYGIKFNGAQDGYIIDDNNVVMPMIEKAAEYGKAIAFHIGADSYENTHPYRLGHIAAAFPETRFIMIHMGGVAVPPLAHAAIEVAQRYANIAIIGSAIDEKPIVSALKQLGPDRVCFGSDTPFRLMHVRLAMYRALLKGMNPDDQEKVLSGNLLRLLGVA